MVREQLAFLLDIAKHTLENTQDVVFDEEDIPVGSLCLNWVSNESALFSQVDPSFEFTVQNLGGFTAQFSNSILAYLIDLDMVAVNSRFVTGIELLAGFVAVHGGEIPFPKQSSGHILYEDPVNIRAGGLQRHTVATAFRIFKIAIETLLPLAGVQYNCIRSNRVDLGLFVDHWSIHIGWPSHVDQVVSAKVRDWFCNRPYRKACDLARPLF